MIIKFRSVKYALQVLLDEIEFTRNNPNIGFDVQRIHRTAHLATSVQNFIESVCQRSLVCYTFMDVLFEIRCKSTALECKDVARQAEKCNYL